MPVGPARACPALLAALALTAAGCSSKPGNLSGTVRVNGEPLPAGLLTFYSEEGDRPVFNARVENGTYAVDGVRAGRARVTVTPVAGAAPAGAAEAPKDKGDRGAPAPRANGRQSIPPRYRTPEETPLAIDVQPGPQTHDFDLTP